MTRTVRALPVCALAALILAVPLPVAAQGDSGFVVKAGLVASDFAAGGLGAGTGVSAGTVDTFGATSFGFGVSRRLALSDRFALQVEALFLRKASDATIAFEPFPGFGTAFGVVRSRADYLEIPLLVRYEFEVGNARPYGMAGPSVSFRMGSALTGDRFEELLGFGFVAEDLDDRMQSTDLVLSLGAGVDLGVDSPGGWTVELRSSWGLRKLFGSLDGEPVPTEIDARNRSFFAALGYRF